MATSPKVKLIAQLRKETECTLTKAKEALVQCDFDYSKAVTWLQLDMAQSAGKKAAKVSERNTVEGLVGIVSHPFVRLFALTHE
jgi:elongation factor Ts